MLCELMTSMIYIAKRVAGTAEVKWTGKQPINIKCLLTQEVIRGRFAKPLVREIGA